ncbi:MAG TPA: tRNA adenosine(34) deaminase TadA [Candidatus Binatia bacterium]|jgi:tRNA(adenine34) deaminase
MSEIFSQTSAGDRFYMKLALDEAHAAAQAGEIPVGAVVVHHGEVISRAHNRREELQSPMAHAEVLALQAAAERLKSWRLEECSLYVTLEPCLMCVGAILQARLRRLVFGCLDPKGGAVESLYRLCEDSKLNHTLPVTRGIMESECSAVLSEFFAELRKRKISALSFYPGERRDLLKAER